MYPKARTTYLETSQVDDELYVLDLNTSVAHHLHPVTASVWRHADGTRSVADLLTCVQQGDAPSATEAMIWEALDALADAALLEARVAPPSGTQRYSRRDLLVRASAVAAGLSSFAVSPLLAASGGKQAEQEDKEQATKKSAESARKTRRRQSEDRRKRRQDAEERRKARG